MEYRELGRTGWKISGISFGACDAGKTFSGVAQAKAVYDRHFGAAIHSRW